MYKKKLRVCFPEGGLVFANVNYRNGHAIIRVDKLEIVKKDNPEFAKDGVIIADVIQKNYSKMMITIENYLESLMLKELENENRSTSNGVGVRSARLKKSDTSRRLEEDTGEGENTSVHSGTRGDEYAEGSRKRKHSAPVDESGDKESGEENKEGD